MPIAKVAARIMAGFCFRSRARSALTTTNATAPSLSWQQSSRRSGSTIQRERWWSSSVIGLPWNQALGLLAAWRRQATEMRPKSSVVAP